jgi:formylglycine-generating enzyme required for sulfatase activity
MGQSGARANVGPFCLDVNEVTVDSYKPCVDAMVCGEPRAYDPKDSEYVFANWKRAGRGNHPVNYVSWRNANRYCQWQNARLPNEQEWEWAARNGSRGDTYPWGNAPPNETLLNGCGPECLAHKRAVWGDHALRPGLVPLYPADDGWPETAPVGSFPTGDNIWGVHDLAGNVREWTASCGMIQGSTQCAVRGGDWELFDSKFFTAAWSETTFDTWDYFGYGFRCAKSP